VASLLVETIKLTSFGPHDEKEEETMSIVKDRDYEEREKQARTYLFWT